MLLLTRRHPRPALSVQDSDVLTEALKEFADEFPELMRPLIEERDEYMVFLLRTLATRYATSHGLAMLQIDNVHITRCRLLCNCQGATYSALHDTAP